MQIFMLDSIQKLMHLIQDRARLFPQFAVNAILFVFTATNFLQMQTRYTMYAVYLFYFLVIGDFCHVCIQNQNRSMQWINQ